MRHKKPIILIFIAIGLIGVIYVIFNKLYSEEAKLRKLDAVRALELANQWRWSREDVKSYVTPQNVVFELDKNTVVKIPLPEEKMVVAIAPYINNTHQ